MPGTTKEIGKIIDRAEHLIRNGQHDPELAAGMARYGYDEARWKDGETRLQAAHDKIQANEDAYTEQDRIKGLFKKLQALVIEQEDALAGLCSVVLRDRPDLLGLLNLEVHTNGNGSGVKSWTAYRERFSKYLPFVRNLYQKAQTNEEIAAKLAPFDYSPERLAQEAAQIEQLVELRHERELAIARAQQSTADRDAAIDDLKEWLFEAERAAAKAMKKKPQMLEAIGRRVKRR